MIYFFLAIFRINSKKENGIRQPEEIPNPTSLTSKEKVVTEEFIENLSSVSQSDDLPSLTEASMSTTHGIYDENVVNDESFIKGNVDKAIQNSSATNEDSIQISTLSDTSDVTFLSDTNDFVHESISNDDVVEGSPNDELPSDENDSNHIENSAVILEDKDAIEVSLLNIVDAVETPSSNKVIVDNDVKPKVEIPATENSLNRKSDFINQMSNRVTYREVFENIAKPNIVSIMQDPAVTADDLLSVTEISTANTETVIERSILGSESFSGESESGMQPAQDKFDEHTSKDDLNSSFNPDSTIDESRNESSGISENNLSKPVDIVTIVKPEEKESLQISENINSEIDNSSNIDEIKVINLNKNEELVSVDSNAHEQVEPSLELKQESSVNEESELKSVTESPTNAKSITQPPTILVSVTESPTSTVFVNDSSADTDLGTGIITNPELLTDSSIDQESVENSTIIQDPQINSSTNELSQTLISPNMSESSIIEARDSNEIPKIDNNITEPADPISPVEPSSVSNINVSSSFISRNFLMPSSENTSGTFVWQYIDACKIPGSKVSESDMTSKKDLVETVKNETRDAIETYSQFAERVSQEKRNGSPPAVPAKLVPTITRKYHKNYATPDCGAKLLASNKEAQGAGKVINSNRDEYLLNECKHATWFVLELCESLRPVHFEIGNFELFSGSPASVALWGSQRFPTRDWISLGTHKLNQSKDLQRIILETHDNFFKYVKVEVFSHHGSEFYCPISMFRVYGQTEADVINSMDSDDDNDVSGDGDEDENQSPSLVEDEPKSSGIIPNMIRSLTNLLGINKVKVKDQKYGVIFRNMSNCTNLDAKFAINPRECIFAEILNLYLSCYSSLYQKMSQWPLIQSTVSDYAYCSRLTSALCGPHGVGTSVMPHDDNETKPIHLNTSEINRYVCSRSVCGDSYVCLMLCGHNLLAMCHLTHYSPRQLLLTDSANMTRGKLDYPLSNPAAFDKNVTFMATATLPSVQDTVKRNGKASEKNNQNGGNGDNKNNKQKNGGKKLQDVNSKVAGGGGRTTAKRGAPDESSSRPLKNGSPLPTQVNTEINTEIDTEIMIATR